MLDLSDPLTQLIALGVIFTYIGLHSLVVWLRGNKLLPVAFVATWFALIKEWLFPITAPIQQQLTVGPSFEPASPAPFVREAKPAERVPVHRFSVQRLRVERGDDTFPYVAPPQPACTTTEPAETAAIPFPSACGALEVDEARTGITENTVRAPVVETAKIEYSEFDDEDWGPAPSPKEVELSRTVTGRYADELRWPAPLYVDGTSAALEFLDQGVTHHPRALIGISHWDNGQRRTPNTRLLTIPLVEGMPSGMLIAGVTGTGKSGLMRAMVASACYLSPPKATKDQGGLEFFVIDMEKQLADYGFMRNYPHLIGTAGTLAEADALLDRVLAEHERRFTLFAALSKKLDTQITDIGGYNKAVPISERLSQRIVLIDEAAQFSALAGKKAEKTEGLTSFEKVERIARAGRGSGTSLMIGTQYPTTRAGLSRELTTQLPWRIATRLNDQIQTQVVMGGTGDIKAHHLPTIDPVTRQNAGRVHARMGGGIDSDVVGQVYAIDGADLTRLRNATVERWTAPDAPNRARMTVVLEEAFS